MKNTLLIFFLFYLPVTAQQFPGYRTSNYSGANGVFFNPSSLADNHYAWDINLAAVSLNINNNTASYKAGELMKSLRDSIPKFQFKTPEGKAKGLMNLSIHGPSAMVSLNNKSGIAITTAYRIILQASDWDGDQAKQFLDPKQTILVPYRFQTTGSPFLNIHAFKQIGISYARVVQDDIHFLKAGATLKFLSGTGSVFIQADNVNATLNADNTFSPLYLQNTTGNLHIGMSKFPLSNTRVSDFFKMNNTGLGADFGFTYEYRPDYDPNSYDEFGRNSKEYSFKIALSLLDFGKIKYERDFANSGSWVGDVSIGERWQFNEDLTGKGIDEVVPYLNSIPELLKPFSGYKSQNFIVNLPATVHIDADIMLGQNMFVNAGTTIGLPTNVNPWRQQNYSSFLLTPRFENRFLGFYLPITYNVVSKMSVGAGLRAGPIFLGSGSFPGSLFGRSNQYDFFAGLHLGKFPKLRKEKEKIIREPRSKNKAIGCYKF